jgi:hypothetical protein
MAGVGALAMARLRVETHWVHQMTMAAMQTALAKVVASLS